jgi:4a-hydroxytetrahydrobiopterin dehydratase
MPTLDDLLSGRCHEYTGGSPTLTPTEVQARLPLVPGWELVDDGKGIRLIQRMADFQTVIDFVVEVAKIAEEQQHHPDIQVRSYRTLQLDFSTHSIGGLTDNDFIMAARVNALRRQA